MKIESGEKLCLYTVNKQIETDWISEDINLEGVEAPIMQDREDDNSMFPVIKNIQDWIANDFEDVVE